jgi:two-component system cell cycle sensor histidine kinase/response regulator CckA
MLAGAVAHDFNNVLTGILGHTTYLKAILPQSGPHIESLSAIEDGTKKGASMTQQVLSFSKLDSVEGAVEVPLAELIGKTTNLVKKAIPHRLKLEVKLLCAETWVLAVEGQIMQALVNLIMNAKDAIEDQGVITINLSHEEDPEKLSRIFHGADISAKKFVVLSVKDTGSGIPEENLSRVFERFFTTKREKGTGLGLSTVFEIAQGLGGTVSLSSQVGVGTSVGLYLPVHRVDEQQTNNTANLVTHRVPKGSENILIVDDEAPVRNILAVSLQHLGYKVTAVESALVAVESIKSNGLPYDLIISDMLMPGMSGEQFHKYLIENHKDANVPFLIISGFSAEGSVHRLLQAGAAGFLPKPFTIEDLSKEVRKILDSKK